MKYLNYKLFLIIFGLTSVISEAQNVPDAGSLMRQTEQMLRQEQMKRNSQRIDSFPPVAHLNDATLVQVQRFKFNGNQLIETGQLHKVAAPFLNRPLAQRELQQLTDAVTETYRQAGGVAQVYIPRQDLTGVELVIQVVESRPR
jgi:hemolysin activation/secretion protein